MNDKTRFKYIPAGIQPEWITVKDVMIGEAFSGIPIQYPVLFQQPCGPNAEPVWEAFVNEKGVKCWPLRTAVEIANRLLDDGKFLQSLRVKETFIRE